MEERVQFTFFRSYYEALKSLPKKEREPVMMAICSYALDGEEPELSGIALAIFSLVKPTIDIGRKRAESGKQGGSKPKAKSKANTKQTERDIGIGKDKDTGKDIIIPLTPLEIALNDFAKMRKTMRKPLTQKARELTIRELEKLAPGDEQTQVAILNQSIQRGWQGVFPLKEDDRSRPKGTGNVFFDIAREEGLM